MFRRDHFGGYRSTFPTLTQGKAVQNQATIKDGWKVLFAGLFINLTIGVLYSWSVIKKALVNEWGWSNSDASLPYTIAIVVWGMTLLVAGRMQDKIGPRKVVTVGAIMTGLGLILSSFLHSVALLSVSFGVLAGTGISFAYSSVTPPALKWFHPSKKGMVTGIVVSGMGLASLYIAPLTTHLLQTFGISKTFLILGLFILCVATPLAQLLKNPPEGYVPPEPKHLPSKAAQAASTRNFDWKEMVKTRQFYFLWLMFALASSAGLMIIGNIATIAKTQASYENGSLFVAVLAIFNAVGRLLAGFSSDKIGRVNTMMIVFAIQGLNMAFFSHYDTALLIAMGTALAGIGYGSLLALFPSAVADFYGVKNLGMNYGVVYTAWGVAGAIGPIIAGYVVDKTGNYDMAYFISAGLLVITFVLALLTKPVKPSAAEAATEEPANATA